MNNVPIGFLFVLIFSLGCESNNAEPAKQISTSATYYYYPRANVYYEPQGGNYTFLDIDGVTWKESKELPVSLDSILGKNVVLTNISYPVQQKNEEHMIVYSASLYSSPSDFREAPVAQKITKKDDTIEEQKKDKKGLGRFIDKIFEKRKKEEKQKTKKDESENEG